MSRLERDSAIIQNLVLLYETQKAYLIKDPDGSEHWIPKSQVIDINIGEESIDPGSGRRVKKIEWLTIPEWLADKNNL